MDRVSVSPRVLLGLGAVVALVAIIELTPLSAWLRTAGFTAIYFVAPLAVLGIALMGVWTGVKYVRDRGWQE